MKIASISMNDMLVHSWANDFQALQAIDVPMSADTSVAVPELTRLCRELIGNDSARKNRPSKRAKRNWRRSTRTAAPNGCADAASQRLAERNFHRVVGAWRSAKRSGAKTGFWSTARPTVGRAGCGISASRINPSAAAAAPVLATVPARRSARRLALKGSGKLAVAIQSDGDMLMTSSALWTAAKHRIPLLMVMHNNQSYYNSEEHGIEVAKFRKRPVENAGIGTHVDDPAIDFATMAKSFGVNGEGPVAQSGRPAPGHRARRQIRQREAIAVFGRCHRRTALEPADEIGSRSLSRDFVRPSTEARIKSTSAGAGPDDRSVRLPRSRLSLAISRATSINSARREYPALRWQRRHL